MRYTSQQVLHAEEAKCVSDNACTKGVNFFQIFHAYGQFNDMKRVDTKGTNEIRIHVQLRLSMQTTNVWVHTAPS